MRMRRRVRMKRDRYYSMDTVHYIEHDNKEYTLYDRIAYAIADFCRGSGFDSEWRFLDKGKYVKAITYWHLMNNTGYYMGEYLFTVIIPKKDPGAFRLHGAGDNKRLLENYGVWDYLEQSIYQALENKRLAGLAWEARKACSV
jgi:hypothetical protein